MNRSLLCVLFAFALSGCLYMCDHISDPELVEKRYAKYITLNRDATDDPKVVADVTARMRAIRLPRFSVTAKDNLKDAVLLFQKASSGAVGEGGPVLFALRPLGKGERYPNLCQMECSEISLFDALRLVVDIANAKYSIREDGIVVLEPKDWICDDGCEPGTVWLLARGHWPMDVED